VQNAFRGFAADSFEFFRELSQNNNKMWFDQNRERYQQHVVGAFRSLLDTLTPSLLEFNPHFETGGKTNQNFSRINRDIRFSKDKSPYKSNFYLYAYDGRHDRGHAGRLYVGLSADCLTVGFSIYAMEGKDSTGTLASLFRKRVVSHRQLFDRLLESKIKAKRYETYWHRLEKGDWTQHSGLPRSDQDWQTLQAWIVRKVFLPNARGLATPAFAQTVMRIFADLYPLYVFTSAAGPKWEAGLRK
jgi:uncharacterized protein (TIGR02453 family)